MTIREQLEMREENTLSKFACASSHSKGRKIEEEKCPIRTDFQRDADRIIHSKAFRRLRLKTQVFLSAKGDHYRTRLTHTLEVSQIARCVARSLNLNEDLTEAIALGHDVGHTPFGHAGEKVLREVCPFPFHHYEQSVRVLEQYEKDGRGLNLTYEVLDGIISHTPGSGYTVSTREGKIVEYADRIAYMNHDIEDAIRAGILSETDIPADITQALGNTKSKRITTFVMNMIEHGDESIGMDADMERVYQGLNDFMFQRVYTNHTAKNEESKVEYCMKQMYYHLIKKPELLPAEYMKTLEREGAPRAVCDFIAGMSDGYFMDMYRGLFLPQAWAKY